jgi:hypothetical protein
LHYRGRKAERRRVKIFALITKVCNLNAHPLTALFAVSDIFKNQVIVITKLGMLSTQRASLTAGL